MLFLLASANGPVSAARKYKDCVVSRLVWMWKGVALGPMSSLLVVVKSDGLIGLVRYESGLVVFAAVAVAIARQCWAARGEKLLVSSSLACNMYLDCLARAPVNVYGGGRFGVGMRLEGSVPTTLRGRILRILFSLLFFSSSSSSSSHSYFPPIYYHVWSGNTTSKKVVKKKNSLSKQVPRSLRVYIGDSTACGTVIEKECGFGMHVLLYPLRGTNEA